MEGGKATFTPEQKKKKKKKDNLSAGFLVTLQTAYYDLWLLNLLTVS